MDAGGVGSRAACVGVRGFGVGELGISKFMFWKLKSRLVDWNIGDEDGTFASRWERGGEDVGDERRGEEDSGEGFTGV